MSRKWNMCVRYDIENRREEKLAFGRVLTAILWPKPEPG